MNYTREQAEEVLNDYAKYHDLRLDTHIKVFLNEKFPQLPETGLVVSENGSIVMRTGEKAGYGFRDSKYDTSESWSFIQSPHDWRPATEEDEKRWKELLIEEAKRRGFKEGVTYKSHWFESEEIRRLSNDEWQYNNNDYKHITLCKFGFPWVFKNGKWAEIIEEPKEVIIDGVTYVPK